MYLFVFVEMNHKVTNVLLGVTVYDIMCNVLDNNRGEDTYHRSIWQGLVHGGHRHIFNLTQKGASPTPLMRLANPRPAHPVEGEKVEDA